MIYIWLCKVNVIVCFGLDVDVCSQIECINGVCEEVNGIYQCTCNTGWEGLTCNTSKS